MQRAGGEGPGPGSVGRLAGGGTWCLAAVVEPEAMTSPHTAPGARSADTVARATEGRTKTRQELVFRCWDRPARVAGAPRASPRAPGRVGARVVPRGCDTSARLTGAAATSQQKHLHISSS